MTALRFALRDPPPGAAALRAEVRAFLAEHAPRWTPEVRARSWMGFDRDFTRAVGARGWIGMCWPKAYGGAERSFLDRNIVLEEMLAAGAPVGAHWIGDRQSGPLILRLGTEAQRAKFLPGIARGDLAFCIGLSEPDSGSDLASLRTRADRVDGGWLLNGRKIWTTFGHLCDWMIALVRTSPAPEGGSRHQGLSQVLVDLRAPGVTIRPIRDLVGEEGFNEITFDDVRLPEDALVGAEGAGWAQATSELAFERSGPDRYMSSHPLLEAGLDALRDDAAAAPGAGARGRAAMDPARHVHRRRRHAPGWRGPGAPGRAGEGPRQRLRTGAARRDARAARHAGHAGRDAPHARLPHADHADLLAARRHAGDHARHHRPRAGAALMIGEELADQLARALADAADVTTLRALEAGAFPQGAWDALDALGLGAALVPEAHGGAGLGFADVVPLLEALGRTGAPVPLAEGIGAAALLAAAGIDAPPGVLTFAAAGAPVPWGRHAGACRDRRWRARRAARRGIAPAGATAPTSPASRATRRSRPHRSPRARCPMPGATTPRAR